jgi:hypothetical protein
LLTVALVTAAALVSCVFADGSPPNTPTARVAQPAETALASLDVEELSFAEAERRAGFHIPRPSGEFPVAYANSETHIRVANGGWLISATEYSYPPLAPTSMGVTVAASGFWGGDASFFDGDHERVYIGGKDGWMARYENATTFAYACGEMQHETIWCVVRAPNTIPESVLEDFLESLN